MCKSAAATSFAEFQATSFRLLAPASLPSDLPGAIGVLLVLGASVLTLLLFRKGQSIGGGVHFLCHEESMKCIATLYDFIRLLFGLLSSANCNLLLNKGWQDWMDMGQSE
ncbi:hypothetical protein PanWU01x14_013250 [Parasponia andersonii]|uniref:Transmembrane protein n=1 Tax=Parasponia andersonii TaxID=3476 RepID=A0A2P5E100_PARAD|nr:hypothetical protein PanWU01x14_013250 [Parasponia andersonii]